MSAFRDRADAGRTLARRLGRYAGRDDVLVLGLPRGGVPVACEVAQALGAPLDVFVVRKLGVPGHAAVPVGAAQACEEFRREVEEVVCAEAPLFFQAVGLWYEDFDQTSCCWARHPTARRSSTSSAR